MPCYSSMPCAGEEEKAYVFNFDFDKELAEQCRQRENIFLLS